MRRFLLAIALAVGATAAASPAAAQSSAPTCEISRPIVFADLGYDSALFHNAVAAMILEYGYGCETEAIPGETIPLINGVANGDIDVIMEIWTANPAAPWVAAEAAGKVVAVGTNFPDASEGWYVPRYVIEGDSAAAPGLRSVEDLKAYAAYFYDPEEPSKGRFYNCPPGQVCEVVNSAKLRAYGLEASFTNFRAGATEAVVAAVEAAILRRQPILFYFWSPTWLLGKYDFYRLEEPPFDPAIWAELTTSPNPTRATAYPVSDVIIGANAAFAASSPKTIAFLAAYETDSAIVSEALAWMRDNDASPREAARHFLTSRQDVWSAWVPPELVSRIAAAAD